MPYNVSYPDQLQRRGSSDVYAGSVAMYERAVHNVFYVVLSRW